MPALVSEKGLTSTQKVTARLERFHWDKTKSEYENYINLDVEHVKAYFGKSPDLSDDGQLLSLLKD